MKPRHILALAAIACLCFAMTACTTVTAPDGTITRTTDPQAVSLAYEAAAIALAHTHNGK